MAAKCIASYKPLFNVDLLRGKVSLITGGGSGIGFTIAEILMRHGCDTAIVSRDFAKLQAASSILTKATGRRCLPIAADVRKPPEVLSAVDKVLSELGRIDIVVNNAAGNFLCPLSGMSYNAFKTVMEIDAFGTFFVSKATYDKYLKDHGGVILNISATLHYSGQVLQAHAGSAKAAIDALTKHMANEWGPQNIRVVGLAPGPIQDTVGYEKLGGSVIGKKLDESIPLQRLGTRLDIAQSALFLVSEAASYITGQTLVVDGGSWMNKMNNMGLSMELLNAVASKI